MKYWLLAVCVIWGFAESQVSANSVVSKSSSQCTLVYNMGPLD